MNSTLASHFSATAARARARLARKSVPNAIPIERETSNQPASGVSTAQPARFSALESWRGLAAVLVVVYHSPFFGHTFTLPFVRNSYLFVDFFFVLSGFVITYAYLARLTTPVSYGVFLIRRFGRLWPLHMTMLGLFLISELLKLWMVRRGFNATEIPFDKGFSLRYLPANIFLLQGMGVVHQLNWNFPSWSISTELYAYIMFALVVATFKSSAKVMGVAAAICVACALIILFRSPNPAKMAVFYDYGYMRCLYGFFTGHLVYRLYAYLKRHQRTIPLPALTEFAVVAIAVCFITFAGGGAWSVAAPLAFFPVVLVFAFEAGPISRTLQLKPLRRIGTWSYSIYMVHVFVGQIVIERSAHAVERLYGVTLFHQFTAQGYMALASTRPHALYWMDALNLLNVAVVIAASYVTYTLVEDPSRRFFNRLSVIFNRKMTDRPLREVRHAH